MSNWIERRFARQGDQPPLADKAVGVKMDDRWRGKLTVGGLKVRVVIEQEEWVHLRAAIADAPTPVEALRCNHALPGNMRFARTAEGMCLLADTRLDGVAHLPATFAEVRAGLARARAAPRVSTDEDGQRGAKAELLQNTEAALARLGWGEDRLAKRDGGWELRLPARGDVQIVRVAVADSSLHLAAPLLTIKPENSDAVATAALQLNAQLRLARYALDEERLQAESRLHAGLLGPHWLLAAAEAVAAAQRFGRRLRLLADCPLVRDSYVRLFPVAVPR